MVEYQIFLENFDKDWSNWNLLKSKEYTALPPGKYIFNVRAKVDNIETNIETSGSSPLSGNWNWICVSPKKFKEPLLEVIEKANELKIVVFNKSDFEWAEKYAALVNENCILYLQPEWDKAEQVLPSIIDYVKQNPKWKISLQTHKYLQIP